MAGLIIGHTVFDPTSGILTDTGRLLLIEGIDFDYSLLERRLVKE